MFIYGTKYSPAISVYGLIEDLELFKRLINAVEVQINAWLQEIAAADIEQLDTGWGGVQEIRHFCGIDDSTWHFDTVFNEYFPNILRRSLLISLFNLLETEFTKLCKCFEDTGHLKLSLNDIRDKVGWTKKIEIYLLKVVGLNFPSKHNSWINIDSCRKLRNLIVHHNGNIKMYNNNNVKYFIQKSQYLEIVDDEVRINEGFLHFFTDDIKLFLLALLQEIKIFHAEQQS